MFAEIWNRCLAVNLLRTTCFSNILQIEDHIIFAVLACWTCFRWVSDRVNLIMALFLQSPFFQEEYVADDNSGGSSVKWSSTCFNDNTSCIFDFYMWRLSSRRFSKVSIRRPEESMTKSGKQRSVLTKYGAQRVKKEFAYSYDLYCCCDRSLLRIDGCSERNEWWLNSVRLVCDISFHLCVALVALDLRLLANIDRKWVETILVWWQTELLSEQVRPEKEARQRVELEP